MGNRNDDLSIALAKAKQRGFFPDVSDWEVDSLQAYAKKLFSDDEVVNTASAPSFINMDYFIDQAFNPPAAADLPTIAVSATTATALTGPKVFKPKIVGTGFQTTSWTGQDDINFRINSGEFFTSNGGSADLGLYGQIKPQGGGVSARWPVVLTFDTTSDVVEIYSYGLTTSTSLRVMVNDKWVSEGCIDRSSVVANGLRTTLTFPSSRVRRVTLFDNGDIGYSEIRINNAYHLWKPKSLRKRTGVVVGDSFIGGANTWATNGALQNETWGTRLLYLMGADNIVNAGIGSTGWLTGSTAYSTRIAKILEFNPDFIVFYGSVNDVQSGIGVQAAVEAVLDSVSNVPEVYVISPLTVGWEAQRDAIKAGTLSRGRRFIDMTGFIFGSGKVGATTGDGNADLYRLADGTHPTSEAHRMAARRAFQAINYRYALS